MERKQRDQSFVLDVLRVLAMIGVLIVHFPIYSGHGISASSFGAYGVQIFFILSGYLSVYSIRNRTTKQYYLSRIKRIIPTYYVMILLAMIWGIIKGKALSINWVRYFTGLNTVIPSYEYDTWNNIYGWWTMSCFLCFYLFVPLIYRFANTTFKASIFVVLSFIAKFIWKAATVKCLQPYGFDKLDVLAGASIFGVLYQFGLGIVLFYYCEHDGKQTYEKILYHSVIIIFLSLGIVTKKYDIVACSVTCLCISSTKSINFDVDSRIKRAVSYLSKNSFYVYLTHFICFEITASIMSFYCYNSVIVYAFLSTILIIILVCLLNCVDRKVMILDKGGK